MYIQLHNVSTLFGVLYNIALHRILVVESSGFDISCIFVERVPDSGACTIYLTAETKLGLETFTMSTL